MFNPHPPLAHAPLLLCFLLLAEFALTSTKRWTSIDIHPSFSNYLVFLLCLISPITYYSGYWGADFANADFKVPEEAILSHQSLAQLFLISLVPTALFAILRRQNPSKLVSAAYFFFLLLGFSIVFQGSREGGKLVYEHGAAVSGVIKNESTDSEELIK
jgi:uncharacterized membrane protein